MAPFTGCPTACAQWRIQEAPVKWLLDQNRAPLRNVFIIASVTFLAFATSRMAAGSEGGWTLFDALWFMPTIVGLIVARLLSRLGRLRASVEMGIIVFLFAGMILCGIGLVLFTIEFVERMRFQAIVMIMWKAIPAAFGFPLFHTVLILLFSVLADYASLQAMTMLYQDVINMRMFFSSIAYAIGWLGVSVMNSHRLWSIFTAQEALTMEKALLESIISMICDASVWLSEDGRTILRTDRRFDMMMGRDMIGEQMGDSLAEEEQLRLQDCLTRAKTAPALLPTTLLARAGHRISVDFFIVGNRHVKPEGQADQTPAFLIGVRVSSNSDQPPIAEAVVRQEQLDLLESPSAGQAEQPLPEDRQSGFAVSSTPETDFTGHVFTRLEVEPWLQEPNKAVCTELASQLERVAALGRQQHWLMSAEEVQMAPDQVLGSGGFGVVVSGWLHGSPVAVKTTKCCADSAFAKHMIATANEVRILRHLRHPNVVLFYGACVEPAKGEVMLVLERLQGPNLHRYVMAHSEDAEVLRRFQLLLDIACALRYLHAQKPQIVHGDLKDNNILVEPGIPRAKIIDFGLARLLTKHAKPLGGTLDWMAPEIIRGPKSKPTPSADAFSFGRLAYLIVACRKPLEGMRREVIIKMAKTGAVHPLTWEEGRPLQEECRLLCAGLLDFAPERRPDMAAVHGEVSSWALPGLEEEETPALALARASEEDRARARAARWAAEAFAPSGEAAAPDAVGAAAFELALPERKPTWESVKKLMIMDAAMQWNFPVRCGACCKYHAAVSELARVIGELARMECNHPFAPHSCGQCKACGLLDIEAHNCCPMCDKVASVQSVLLSAQMAEVERYQQLNQPNIAAI